MSDPKSDYGQPVEEPEAADDDVVGRAQQGLADAEAARRDAIDDRRDDLPGDPIVASDTADSPVPEERVEPASRTEVRPDVQPPTPDRPATTDAAVPAAASVYTDSSATTDEVGSAPSSAPPSATAESAPDRTGDSIGDEDGRYAMYEASADQDTRAYPAEPETVVVAPVAATPVEPVAPAAPQPIFVQAPEAPRARGNRGAAGAIGLLAALCFAVLYLAAALALGLINGLVTGANVGNAVVGALGTWALWVPVVVFFIAFWLLGAIINRGRWGVWVVFGILVGLASYGGHILGELFQAPFWTLTSAEGADLVRSQLLAPLAIAAFVIGRELTIWFGAWVAARGRRVTEVNIEARREYERTLEAGPQLSRL